MALVNVGHLEMQVVRSLKDLPYRAYLCAMSVLLLEIRKMYAGEQGQDMESLVSETIEILKCKASPDCSVDEGDIGRLPHRFRELVEAKRDSASTGLVAMPRSLS